MDLKRSQLNKAVEDGLISQQQADELWMFLSDRGMDTPSFRFADILYYAGGLGAIGAMSLFMTLNKRGQSPYC